MIIFVALNFYFENQKKKEILLSENYIQAKVYIERGNKVKAKDVLMDLILSNNSTYSILSLFLVLDQNLITDHKVISGLFDHLIENNEFEKEIKNL